MLNLIVASVRGGARVTRDAKSRLNTILIAASIRQTVVVDEVKKIDASRQENEMHQIWKMFAFVVSVGVIGQPATAESAPPTKCQIQVEMTQAAEKQLGGALYSGPKLTPKEIMATMKNAHQVHHPQHDGTFSMAPNKMNHVEVIYSKACGARVYVYNAFTVPINVDRFLAFVEFVPLDDDQFEVIRFLQPSKDGSYLGTDASPGVEPPFDLRLFMKFPESDQVELFTVKLQPAQSQFVEGTGIVVKIDLAAGKLVINHTAIPGYMGAMEMPYAVSSPNLLDRMEPGMQIKFTIDREKNTIVKVDPIVG